MPSTGPRFLLGVPHGTPCLRQTRGQDRYPCPGQDRGYPRVLSMGTGWVQTPPPLAETEQQSEHLLHAGRYVSCFHAGELSCLNLCVR